MRRLVDAWKDDLDPFVHWLFQGSGTYLPEQGLWAAVLQRAVMDFDLWRRGRRISGAGLRPRTNSATQTHYLTARRWIWENRAGDCGLTFDEVCDYLLLDPAAVRELVARGLPDSVYHHYRAGSATTRIMSRTKPHQIQARQKRRRKPRRAA